MSRGSFATPACHPHPIARGSVHLGPSPISLAVGMRASSRRGAAQSAVRQPIPAADCSYFWALCLVYGANVAEHCSRDAPARVCVCI